LVRPTLGLTGRGGDTTRLECGNISGPGGIEGMLKIRVECLAFIETSK